MITTMNTQTKAQQQQQKNHTESKIAQIVSSSATTLFTFSPTEWRPSLILCAATASPHDHLSLSNMKLN